MGMCIFNPIQGTDKLVMLSDNYLMRKSASLYKRHRFPPEIIQYAVWLYYHFNLSQRDIEDLLAERGIVVSYESIRLWCNKFGPAYTRRLKRRHQGFGDTFYIDEVFVNIRGKRHYLWRAVDQDGEVVRERGICGLKSIQQAQRFLSVHSAVYNLFNLGRHSISAKHYRSLRMSAFASWKAAVA